MRSGPAPALTRPLVPEQTLIDLGDTVLNVTVLPYMRTTYDDGNPFYIALDVHGLMPNIQIACTIDGTIVDLEPTGTTVAGSSSYEGHSTVKTKGSGGATCRFHVPSGIAVGQKAIKVFSTADPNASYAISVFSSMGFLETHQHQYYGIISTTERDETVSESEWHYGDPLAETFAVTSGTQWISYVKFWFASKDPELPITCEIRETLNGYPTRTVLQTCTLYPET